MLNELAADASCTPPISGAVEELCRAATDPGFDLREATRLRSFLSSRPPDHQRERNPVDVLAAIQTNFIPDSPRPIEEEAISQVLSRLDLLFILRAKLSQSTPEWAVFISLVLCYGIERARDVLVGWLPGPQDMLPEDEGDGGTVAPRREWLISAKKILEGWGELLALLGSGGASGGTSNIGPDWLEIPEKLRNDPKGSALLTSAIETIDDWLAGPATAPSKWQAVPPDVEEAIRGALFIVIMEELIENMTLVYRARRKYGDKVPPFPDYVLGGPERPSSSRPEQVVQTLQDIERRK